MAYHLKDQLREYKRRYYLNLLLKGGLLGSALLLSAFLAAALLEYYNNFNSAWRSVLFVGLSATLLYVLVRYIGRPAFGLLSLNKSMSDEEAARQIGQHFPEVKDKLLNTLQLERLTARENSLIAASLKQRTKALQVVRFSSAINFKANSKYLKYALPPLFIVLLLTFWQPQIFTKSTTRIIRFNQEFEPEAPFAFSFQAQDRLFKGEAYTAKLNIEGDMLPESAYILVNGSRHKMKAEENGTYTFTISGPESDLDLQFEAAGFYSRSYAIPVVARPSLVGFEAQLDYPAYLNKQDESISNVGSFTVPEGTKVTWLFKAMDAEALEVAFAEDSQRVSAKKAGEELWELEQTLRVSQNYSLHLKNPYGENKEQIRFSAEVIPDQYPSLDVERHTDTTLYSYLLLGGQVSDDYGLSRLKLFYRIIDEKGKPKGKFKTKAISLQAGQTSQQFFYQWDIEPLNLKNGESLEHYLMVWDNDGVNGPKATRSQVYRFQLPSKEQMEENLEATADKTENKIDETLNQAKEINKEIEKLKERVKSKRKLDWQDQKVAEKLLDKHQNLEKQIKELQQQYRQNKEMQERFNKNPQLKEKMESLQKLMDELLDEETKEKLKELQELMRKNAQDPDEMRKALEEMQKKDFNLENELDRAMEMFKQLKFEQKMSQTQQELDSLAKEQKKLADKTKKLDEDKSLSKDQKEAKRKEIEKKQKDIQKDFEDVKKDMEELKKMNEDLENPNEMSQQKENQEQAEKEMQEGQQNLQKNKMNKASENQQKASDKMKEMADQMMEDLMSMQKEGMQEDMQALRQILENLITLSFNQEELMKAFREVRQRDPRFVELGQRQLKLRDDAQIIEDSLLALAKRVFQIESFVTREVTEMNDHMQGAIDGIRERRRGKAASQQQLAMTSMNNLALLLNDVLKQMQQSMASKMKGSQNCNKPGGGKPRPGMKKGGKKGMPSLSQMQQSINQRIEQLKKSGKTGRALSEELAKLAAEQEALRRALQELEKEMSGGEGGKKDGGKKGGGGNSLKELEKEMEETEEDLVNKRLTEEVVKRQREILTRLLESEKAMRERGFEEKRESRTGKELNREIPPNFEKYLKAKEKQVELLKTISPELTPFYKEESNRYFKELSN